MHKRLFEELSSTFDHQESRRWAQKPTGPQNDFVSCLDMDFEATLRQLEAWEEKTRMPEELLAERNLDLAMGAPGPIASDMCDEETAIDESSMVDALMRETAGVEGLIADVRDWRERQRRYSLLLELSLVTQARTSACEGEAAAVNDGSEDLMAAEIQLESVRQDRSRVERLLEGGLEAVCREPAPAVAMPVSERILGETMCEINGLDRRLAALAAAQAKEEAGNPTLDLN